MIKKLLSWIGQHKLEFCVLAVILIIGGFLRLYHVGGWMPFGSDEGKHATMAASIIREHKLLLLGPGAPNNRADFYLGPFYYYLIAPFIWLGGYSPAGGAVAVAIFSVLSIFFVYLVGKNLFSARAGLLAAGLYAPSFLMVYYGRWMWNPNFVPFFALLIILCLYKITKISDNPKSRQLYFYLLALGVGLIIQLHGTALIILPPLLICYFVIFRPRFSWKQYLLALLIFIAVSTPLIVYDLTHSFSNFKGFWHVLTQSNSEQTIGLAARFVNTIKIWKNFWSDSMLHARMRWPLLAIASISAAFIIIKLWAIFKERKKDAGVIILFLWLFVSFFIFTFYKDLIPTHYFCFIFPLPFILLAAGIDYFMKFNRYLIIFGIAAVISLSALQLYYSINLLIDLGPQGSRASSYPVTLNEMQQVVDYVIKDSQGRPFSFASAPIRSYDEGYQYLFDLKKIKPGDNPAGIKYETFNGKKSVLDSMGLQPIKNSVMIGNIRLVTY